MLIWGFGQTLFAASGGTSIATFFIESGAKNREQRKHSDNLGRVIAGARVSLRS